MNTGFDIYVPCEIFDVQVCVGPDIRLSTLEQTSIEMLHAGIKRFEDLERHIGIGHRPTLDLIFDLWHRGYVVVDTGRDEVLLAESVKQRIADGTVQSMESGERVERKERLMLELLSGHVLPVPRLPPDREPWSQVVPPRLPSGSFSKARRAEMLDVLDRMMQRRQQQGRPLRVLEINLDLEQSSGLLPVGKPRNLRLHVDCSIGPADTLSFRIVYPPEIGKAVRRDMESALNQLSDELRPHMFFKQLRERVTTRQDASAPKTYEDPQLSRALFEQVDLLSSVSPTDAATVHVKLIELHEAAVRDREREVKAELVCGKDRLVECAQRAMATASRQLVLATPNPYYRGFAQFLEPIESALKRDVQCFILWGQARESVLDPRIGSELETLVRRYPGLLSWSELPSRSNGMFLVRDGKAALLGCADFLGDIKGAEGALGVWMESSSEQQPCKAAIDLLAFCQQVYPDYSRSRGMFTLPEELGMADEPIVPPTAPSLGIDSAHPLARASLNLWRQQWIKSAAELFNKERGASIPLASMVRNGEHLDLLWRAFLESSKRVLISSDSLSADVIDSHAIDALTELLRKRVQATIFYRQAPAELVQQLQQLSVDGQRLTLVKRESLRHRLVIWDDWCLLTSATLLSRDRHQVSQQRALLSSDVGILLDSEPFATRMLQAVTSMG